MKKYLKLICRKWRQFWENRDYLFNGSDEE